MQKNNILEKINKSALNFLVPLTPEETYQTIVNEAVNLAGGSGYASIILKEPNDELKRVYASLPLAYTTKNRKRATTYQVFKRREVVIAPMTNYTAVHPQAKKFKTMGVKWVIFIPLAYQNKSIGVVTVNSKKGIAPTKKNIETLKLFGSMACLAIKKTQLYNQAKEALEIRDYFISIVAHELRTPLTTISGYSQLLKSKLNGSNGLARDWINQINTESNKMTELINDFLEVNKIRTGKHQYVWKEYSIKKILDYVLSRFKLVYPERKINFKSNISDKNDLIIADFEKIVQVLGDILDNAVKFSPTNSKILITLNSSSSYLVVRIEDAGVGIEKEHLSRIFEGFYKGIHMEKEGIGVGLYLAKHIIEHHNGSIKIKSKANEGTIVEVKLPLLKI